jgi:hypothetical protein
MYRSEYSWLLNYLGVSGLLDGTSRQMDDEQEAIWKDVALAYSRH